MKLEEHMLYNSMYMECSMHMETGSELMAAQY